MFVYAFLFLALAYCAVMLAAGLNASAVREAATAHSFTIAGQFQLIQDSAERYRVDKGGYPLSLDELISGDYLKPLAPASAEQVRRHIALPEASWVVVAPGIPVYAMTGATAPVCSAINRMSFSTGAVPKTAQKTEKIQCYGENGDSLKIVQAKTPADLEAASAHPSALIPIGPVLPLPTPSSPPALATVLMRGF